MNFTNLKKKILVFIVIFLMLSSMACFLSQSTGIEISTPEENPILPESNEVVTFLEDLQSQTGTFAFTVTEEQMTSYLTLKANENQAPGSVEDINVLFRENQITLSGDVFVQSVGIKVPVQIGLLAKVDENGMLFFEIVAVEVANMTLPESLEQSLSAMFTDLMNSQFANYFSGYKIDTVFINSGLLTISGEKR